MTPRRRQILLEKVALPMTGAERPGERRELRIELRYEEGGMNYATYKTSARGYYVGMTPITIDVDGAYRFLLFSGKKFKVEEAARFSEKKLGALVQAALSHPMYAACKAELVGADAALQHLEGGHHAHA